MSKHQASSAQLVIRELQLLGEALGYSVRFEILTKPKAVSPASDVGWFREGSQRFPLMVFEVETSPTNSAVYNAVKVFGTPNNDYEKPLFFFHLFVSGATSSRLSDLQSQYANRNYRVYRLAQGESGKLLRDIITQHRRVSDTLNLVRLGAFLAGSRVFHPDFWPIVEQVESLNFDEDLLAMLARLAFQFPSFVRPFVSMLEAFHSSEKRDARYPCYPTYVGTNFSTPIHFALLQYTTHAGTGHWLDRLCRWQEEGTWIHPQIGPHFGLDRDYDFFLGGMASAFWALIAALMKTDGNAGDYIFRQCALIADEPGLVLPCYELYSAWMLHIAAAYGLEDHFEARRSAVNRRTGGLPRLYDPPGLVDPEYEQLLDQERYEVPCMSEFRIELRNCFGIGSVDGFHLGLSALLDTDVPRSWGEPIRRLLAE